MSSPSPDGPPPRRGTPSLRPATVAALASGACLIVVSLLAPRPAGRDLALVAVASLLGLAGVYRPFRRGRAGLGAAPMPALAISLGAPAAAWATVLARLLSPALLRRLTPTARLQERRGLPRRVADALVLGLVTLAAASIVRASFGAPPVLRMAGDGASLLVYVSGLWAAERLQRMSRHAPRGSDLGGRERDVRAALWDALGWTLGLLAAPAVAAAGWLQSLPLFVALTALAWIAASERGRAVALRDQLQALERVATLVSTPSRRRSDLPREISRSVAQILEFGWLEVGLLDASGSHEIHSTELGGRLQSGPATPPAHPPPLPGVHRRRGWTVLDRPLSTSDRYLGYLKIWCDPRRVDSARAELLEALIQQLAATVERVALGAEANLDPLTGLVKRPVFEQRLAKSFEQSRQSGAPMAVAMLDIDWFKNINDTWGHAAGDRALVEVSRTLKQTMRRADLCCRYGGEEFAMVLDGLDGPAALVAVDRLREAVESLETVFEGDEIDLTLSAGVAAIPELVVEDWRDLLELADQALYAAKRSGRNRTLLSAGPERFRGVEGVAYGPPSRPPAAPQL